MRIDLQSDHSNAIDGCQRSLGDGAVNDRLVGRDGGLAESHRL